MLWVPFLSQALPEALVGRWKADNLLLNFKKNPDEKYFFIMENFHFEKIFFEIFENIFEISKIPLGRTQFRFCSASPTEWSDSLERVRSVSQSSVKISDFSEEKILLRAKRARKF